MRTHKVHDGIFCQDTFARPTAQRRLMSALRWHQHGEDAPGAAVSDNKTSQSGVVEATLRRGTRPNAVPEFGHALTCCVRRTLRAPVVHPGVRDFANASRSRHCIVARSGGGLQRHSPHYRREPIPDARFSLQAAALQPGYETVRHRHPIVDMALHS